MVIQPHCESDDTTRIVLDPDILSLVHNLIENNSIRSLRIKTTINTCYETEYFIYTGFITRDRETILNFGVRRSPLYYYIVILDYTIYNITILLIDSLL